MVSAKLMPSTKSLNTKKERKVKPHKEEDVTTESSQDMEDRPNPSSERKPKQPRKLPSDCNATNAREEDVVSLAEPNQSSFSISKKSERRSKVEEISSSDDR